MIWRLSGYCVTSLCIIVALVVGPAIIIGAGAGDPAVPPSSAMAVTSSIAPTTTVKPNRDAGRILWLAIAKRRDDIARFTAAVEAARFAGVMQCIKNHESGDYTEHSHVYDGSGAFQVIPDTWRYWSPRAGHGEYALAYLAPAAVQDAVVRFMLANGGAGNWSPRFGDDPCTVAMGG